MAPTQHCSVAPHWHIVPPPAVAASCAPAPLLVPLTAPAPLLPLPLDPPRDPLLEPEDPPSPGALVLVDPPHAAIPTLNPRTAKAVFMDKKCRGHIRIRRRPRRPAHQPGTGKLVSSSD